MKKALLSITSLLFLLSGSLHASETRVDSFGGLTLVVTDESDAINPFTLGNPAGLALIDPQTRFDAEGSWVKEVINYQNNGNNVMFTGHDYGAMDEFGGDTVKYHGLIAFPTDRWAIQVDGDTLHNDEFNTANDAGDVNSVERTRELFRTAYNFGPFVLGAEVQPIQENESFIPGPIPNGPQLLSGNGTINTILGNFGLLASLLGDPSPKKEQLEIGGIFSTQLNPLLETDNFSKLTTSFLQQYNETDTIQETSSIAGGPEIYYRIPGVFEAALIGLTGQESFSLAINYFGFLPDQATFNVENADQTVGLAVFKMTNPISSSLNLKSGTLFSLTSQNNHFLNPSAAPVSNVTGTTWTAEFGLGLEHPQDFTMGFQGEATGINDTQDDPVTTIGTTNYFSYKVSFGGERWLSPFWAIRMGIIYENDLNTGNQDVPLFFYTVGPDSRIISTTITAGVGYQDARFKLDLGLLAGQPSQDNSSNFGTQYGAQLAAGIFFN
jgi:hypothetical protein